MDMDKAGLLLIEYATFIGGSCYIGCYWYMITILISIVYNENIYTVYIYI